MRKKAIQHNRPRATGFVCLCGGRVMATLRRGFYCELCEVAK
jgi:hypothetical protein